MNTDMIFEPIIQYGFLGMCSVLLAIIIWLIRELLKVIRENNLVIDRNTRIHAQSIENFEELGKDLRRGNEETRKAVWSLHDKLISRPCIARREQGGD